MSLVLQSTSGVEKQAGGNKKEASLVAEDLWLDNQYVRDDPYFHPVPESPLRGDPE
jgi:hypothetical protein